MMMHDKKKIAVIIASGLGSGKSKHEMSDHPMDKDMDEEHGMHKDAMKMAMSKFIKAVKAEDVDDACRAMEEWHDIAHSYDSESDYPDSMGEMDEQEVGSREKSSHNPGKHSY